MKVLLVASPKNYFGLDMLVRYPNLGLCSLVGNVDKGLAEFHILDLIAAGRNPDKYFTKIVKSLQPDIIGFTAMMFQFKHSVGLAKIAKAINPEVTILFGGYYTTIDADSIVQTEDMKYIDFLFSGEGELAFNKFIRAFATDKDFSKVEGLTYIENGSVISNPPGCLANIDELKFPDRSARILKNSFHTMGLKADVIETSRGCVYDCNFCSIRQMYGKTFRKFKIERVLQDIRNTKQYGARSLMITDDNITLDGKRYKELCMAIKDSGLNDMRYLLQASVRGIKNTPGLAKAMADSGTKWVFLGIENVSDENLEYMSKGEQFSNQDTYDVVSELRSYGIIVIGGFILGNPDDTEESLWANYHYAKSMKIDLPVFNTITPYPKTGIRAELEKLDLITNKSDFTKYDCWEVNVKTKHLTTEQIDKIRYDINAKYHLNSGAFFTMYGMFPWYFNKLILRLLFRKPSDIISKVARWRFN